MTSAELALRLIQEKKDRKLDALTVRRFATLLPGGDSVSLADQDDALWLAEIIDKARAAGMGEGLEITKRVCSEYSLEHFDVVLKDEDWAHVDRAIAARQSALRQAAGWG